MQKYVDAAYAEASIQIASEKLDESRRMLTKTKRLYELGEKGRPDVVQMESQVAEDEYCFYASAEYGKAEFACFEVGDELSRR